MRTKKRFTTHEHLIDFDFDGRLLAVIIAVRSPRVTLLVLALALSLVFIAEGGTALAAEFTVNSTADTTECASTCTLRGAIAAAEASSDATNTILLPAETFELGAFEEAHPSSTGQLRLDNSAGTTIEIVGDGVGKTIIDAAKHDRVLRTGGGGSVVLEGLTLENGFPDGNEKDNTLGESVRGAGIYQAGGTLTLDQVRLLQDQDNGWGGGIDVQSNGSLKLVNSELDNDLSTSGGGGAVSVEPGTLEATGTTFAVDTSGAGQGGAVQLLEHSSGKFINDTFAGDGFNGFADTYEGGGAYVAENSSASFTNVTFFGNYALGAKFGGADVNADEGAHITFTNTLLGAPIGSEPGELACATFEAGSGVTWTDDGGNLGADGSCHLAPGDMERELKLGELGAYGGPTETVPLLEGSPAIGFGVTGCPATDQRGYSRVGTCDSGAFEFDGVAPKTEESGGSPGGSSGSQAGTSGTAGTTTSSATPTGATTEPVSGVASTPKAIEELLLGCSKRSLVLNDVLISGGHVLLNGTAAKNLVGKKVKILFDGAKQVASATVKAGGEFSTSAPLPPARLRDSNSARYLAESGAQRSLNLKLTRRLILQSPTFSGGAVTLTGQVLSPLTKPASTVTVEQQLECGKTSRVLTFAPPANGRFHVTINGIPANAKAGIYRLTTSVLPKPGTHHAFPTFSLPLPVAFG
jgi:CSLREA domain-containing protein